MRIRRLFSSAPTFGGLVAVSALALGSTLAHADGIEVPLDQVRILTFVAPVKTVFVGNSVFADVTVIDRTHVFVLGKSFGTTNLIALDDKGREVLNEQITVVPRPGSAVTLQRGAGKISLNCNSGTCESAPTPGDDPAPYTAVSGQITARESTAVKAAEGK